jgi:hypothetical protein
MKVEATRLGYYGHKRRRPGVKFDLKDSKHFSESWMKKLDASVKESKPKRGQKPEPKAEKVLTSDQEVI